MDDVILWMNECNKERILANTIMLCTRNEFIMFNNRDITIPEYNDILFASNSAGIIRERPKQEKRCKDCTRPICQRKLTLRGCKQKNIEPIVSEPMNSYAMHDLFMG